MGQHCREKSTAGAWDAAESPKFVETLPSSLSLYGPVEWEADARSADAWSRAARPNVGPLLRHTHPGAAADSCAEQPEADGRVAFIALSVIA